MDLLHRLREHWKSHGIDCPEGVSPSEIAAFESRYQVHLPEDMRAYYLSVNGMGEGGTCDGDFFSFWQLEDVKAIAEDLPDRAYRFALSAEYFLFADHSIHLPAYAIRLHPNKNSLNPVAAIFADQGKLAVEDQFESFTHFVEQYLDHPTETSAALPSSE